MYIICIYIYIYNYIICMRELNYYIYTVYTWVKPQPVRCLCCMFEDLCKSDSKCPSYWELQVVDAYVCWVKSWCACLNAIICNQQKGTCSWSWAKESTLGDGEHGWRAVLSSYESCSRLISESILLPSNRTDCIKSFSVLSLANRHGT